MCKENKSCRIDAHWTCLNSRTLGIIRRSGRNSVPLHRASRHAWIDVILFGSNTTALTVPTEQTSPSRQSEISTKEKILSGRAKMSYLLCYCYAIPLGTRPIALKCRSWHHSSPWRHQVVQEFVSDEMSNHRKQPLHTIGSPKAMRKLLTCYLAALKNCV
jgi:hypothetical protein